MTYFDEEGFIAERQIDQRNWREFDKLRKTMRVFAPGKRSRDVPGLLEFQTREWLEMAARGNLQRLMPSIKTRCALEESAIYEAINGVTSSDMTLSMLEDAVNELLFSERFDVAVQPPTKDSLPEYLQRFVGSYKWLGEFLDVKSNTIAAWVSRGPEKQRERLLAFAQRWHDARLALWPEKPQAQLEIEWLEHLEDREEWAGDALHAHGTSSAQNAGNGSPRGRRQRAVSCASRTLFVSVGGRRSESRPSRVARTPKRWAIRSQASWSWSSELVLLA